MLIVILISITTSASKKAKKRTCQWLLPQCEGPVEAPCILWRSPKNVYIHIHQIDISFESKRNLLDSWGEWIVCPKNGFLLVTSIRLSSTPLPSFRGWCASCTSAVHNLMSSPCGNQKLSSKVFHQDICTGLWLFCYFVWVHLAWGWQLSWS